MSMLEVTNLGISFGGLRAVDNFNVNIEEGQLYGLIGPNGAGKTTILISLPVCINLIRAALSWMVWISQANPSCRLTKTELRVHSRI